MVTGGGGGDSGWEGAGWGLGKVEEVLGKKLAQGIEVWWPEEEMTAGAHNKVNIWVLQRGSLKRAKMRHGRLCLCSIDDGSGVVATWARVC